MLNECREVKKLLKKKRKHEAAKTEEGVRFHEASMEHFGLKLGM